MERYKYIIIDDETPSHLILAHKLEQYPEFKCVENFLNPKEALQYLENNEVDIIFLDIEMPEMNGLLFLEALSKRVFIVILTAYYNKYSIDAHQYYYYKNLIYYANKAQLNHYLPKIIERIKQVYSEKEILAKVDKIAKNEILYFPQKIKNRAILFSDIVTILVIGHNIILNMKDGEELVFRYSFCELTNFLPANNFFQIKRNLIINIDYVTAFTDTTICINNQHVTISHKIKSGVIQALKERKIKLCGNY